MHTMELKGLKLKKCDVKSGSRVRSSIVLTNCNDYFSNHLGMYNEMVKKTLDIITLSYYN